MASPHDAPLRQHHLLLAGGDSFASTETWSTLQVVTIAGVSGTSTNRISILAKEL